MNELKVGDRFTMAYSLMGALNARAGWLVHNETELPDRVRDYLQRLAIPYFRAIAKWYEHIGIGVTGGELYNIIHKEIGDPFFGVGLNEVLPLSNIPAYLPPYILSAKRVLTVRK
ncbi:MAG: hypothetical protein HYZ51_04040 [Candidatus Doudnabacteria bacterium]|nr:hypothetical protein [Candidatus Doudnabacteria bacterium]